MYPFNLATPCHFSEGCCDSGLMYCPRYVLDFAYIKDTFLDMLIAIAMLASGDSKKGLAIANQPFDTRALSPPLSLWNQRTQVGTVLAETYRLPCVS